MTASEKRICHLAARALRLIAAQDQAELDGDNDLAECLDAALGRLAAEAEQIAEDTAEIQGQNLSEVDRVVAALIPRIEDEDMTINHARDALDAAKEISAWAKFFLEEAVRERENEDDNNSLAMYIVSMQKYAHAILILAQAEIDMHMASMPSHLAEDFQRSLESIE